jgi:hypothetical protein
MNRALDNGARRRNLTLMGRVLWGIGGAVLAAALGGFAVVVFTTACGRFNYVAETSGQVAIGTSVYGLTRQIADLISEWWKQLPLRAALSRSLREYIAAAEARLSRPRDAETLAARIRELCDLRPVRERDRYDRALRELRDHGAGGTFALLSDALELTHLGALAARLA